MEANCMLQVEFFARKRSGSALIAVIMVTTFVSFVIAGFLRMADQQLKDSNKTFFYNACLDLAESGVEDAIWAINADDYSGWSTNGTDYWKKIIHFNLDGAQSVRVRVVMTNLATTPLITSEGFVSLAGNDSVAKQIQVELDPRSKFPNGLTAKDTITFSGGNAEVDAYDSNIVTLAGNRMDEGTVATVSALNDAVNIANASIFGFIATGGSSPDIGPNGKVYGQDRVTEVEVHNNSAYFVDTNRITNDFSANFDDVPAPPTGGSALPGTNTTIGDPTGSTIEYYRVTDLRIGNSDTLNIVGPVVLVVEDDAVVKGKIVIGQVAGSLEMYVGGNLDVTGNGMVNLPAISSNSPKPNKILVYGTASSGSGQTFKLAGNGSLAAGIYAPNAEVQLKGGGSSGEMFGAVVAEDIKINGNYAFHYDVRMREITDERSYRMSSWRELTKGSDRYDFLAYF